MKKLILIILILTSLFSSHAQNYQCLQSGVKRYFINGNGYLRASADTVLYIGSDSIFYSFVTPRGEYDALTLPSLWDGGSWLGGKVIQRSDGTFIFDSYWGDSVVIKPQGNVGDTWIFYDDSGAVFYKATVVSKDTMTVLSLLDSVKTIMINAYNSSGHLSSDPLDSFNIILSKNHGFAQVFDLYTFPYHKPDSTYRPGLDFFLDRSTLTPSEINSFGGYPPNEKITIFKLVDFINPNEQQLTNWDTGSVIQSYHWYGEHPLYSSYIYEELSDTIVNKTTSGTVVSYTIGGSSGTCSYPRFIHSPCTFCANAGLYNLNSIYYPIIQPFAIPEGDFNTDDYIFYYPDDTNFCFIGPAYTKVSPGYWRLSGYSADYKLGVGLTYYYYHNEQPNFEMSRLTYFNIKGIRCGIPRDTLAPIDSSVFIKNISAQYYYQISPNPATVELTIKTNNSRPYTIILQNMLGQTIVKQQTTKQQETISVQNIPSGVYNVSITDEQGNRHNEKVFIAH